LVGVPYRAILVDEESRFGRELYSLLTEMLEESLGKAKSRRYKKFMDDEFEEYDEMNIKKEKDDDYSVSSSFQDIVSRLGLKTTFKQEVFNFFMFVYYSII